VEHHLAALDGPLVKDLGRDVLGRQFDALAARLLQHRREQPHLELEGQQVDARGAALAALDDDLLHEQPADRQIDWADHHQPAVELAVEEAGVRRHRGQRLCLVGAQDQLAELARLLFECRLLLRPGQPPADIEVGLPLVAAEVQHLEGAERLAVGLKLPLHADQPLAGRVNGELAEIGGDPLATELLGDGGGGARADEEVGDEVAFVAAGIDDSFQQRLGLLCRIAETFVCHWIDMEDVRPKVVHWNAGERIQILLVLWILGTLWPSNKALRAHLFQPLIREGRHVLPAVLAPFVLVLESREVVIRVGAILLIENGRGVFREIQNRVCVVA
jgi:hypothetical protein